MGNVRRQGRPDDSAASNAAESARDFAQAAAGIVEAARGHDRAVFVEAVGSWCEAAFADSGWGLWVWRDAAFELAGNGGVSPAPAGVLEATGRSLGTEATRTKLSSGRASLLVPDATGPDAAGGAVAFGDAAHLLAVLAVYRSGPRPVVGAADLAALAETARLCSFALAGARSRNPAPAALPDDALQAKAAQPGVPVTLLTDMNGPLEVIVGSAHTLIASEPSLGRVERRRLHEIIEAQALALAVTVDAVELVWGSPVASGTGTALGAMDSGAFVAELGTRLATALHVSVGDDVVAALPATGDARALAIAVAGIAVAVTAAGASHVEVAAAVGDGVSRVGVSSAMSAPAVSELLTIVSQVRSGEPSVGTSAMVPLAIAAAAVVAGAHGGSLGADASGGVIRIWLDLPAPGLDHAPQRR